MNKVQFTANPGQFPLETENSQVIQTVIEIKNPNITTYKHSESLQNTFCGLVQALFKVVLAKKKYVRF